MSFSSGSYWEKRYEEGGDSGRGSRGRLAEFKADFLNEFVQTREIEQVVDLGCGEGNMASLFDFPNYVGFDPSETAVKRCIERCWEDAGKNFFVYYPEEFGVDPVELTISLDIIYHLIEDDVFELHMKHLFASSSRYVIIYSTDYDETTSSPHIKHRNFTNWVEDNIPKWGLIGYIENKYPDETDADFYVYRLKRRDDDE